MTPRQYSRLVSEWIASVGLDPRIYSTHSLRHTKVTLIYRRTGNLRAVQLLLGRGTSPDVEGRCSNYRNGLVIHPSQPSWREAMTVIRSACAAVVVFAASLSSWAAEPNLVATGK
jgi:hypothetical protein